MSTPNPGRIKTSDEVRPYVKVILEASYPTAAILAALGQIVPALVCAGGGTGAAIMLMITARAVDAIGNAKLNSKRRGKSEN